MKQPVRVLSTSDRRRDSVKKFVTLPRDSKEIIERSNKHRMKKIKFHLSCGILYRIFDKDSLFVVGRQTQIPPLCKLLMHRIM